MRNMEVAKKYYFIPVRRAKIRKVEIRVMSV